MIKVGDKFKDELKEWTVSEVYRGAALAFSGNVTREFSKQYIYTIMYLEQKQRADESESLLYTYKENAKSIPDLIEQIQESNKRADELEKRWSELVDVLKKKYEYYKVRADDESVGLIEQDKWKIAKHELMMVLKIMTDLKRGETE